MWVFVMSPECYCEFTTWLRVCKCSDIITGYTAKNDQSSCCTQTFSFICGCYVNSKKVIEREPEFQMIFSGRMFIRYASALKEHYWEMFVCDLETVIGVMRV